jgi:hypothetical protein
MVGTSVMTALCVVGVVFYVRFIVALFNERKRHPTCYLVCMKASYDERMLPNDEQFPASASRAA